MIGKPSSPVRREEKDQHRLAPRRAADPSAWISKHRRTVRDYEHLPASHEAMLLWAMTALMTRRLAQPAHLSDAHLRPAHSPGGVCLTWLTGVRIMDARPSLILRSEQVASR